MNKTERATTKVELQINSSIPHKTKPSGFDSGGWVGGRDDCIDCPRTDG